ncbi:MAG: urease accessory protein UreE [Gammaproteobacteria bacterium]
MLKIIQHVSNAGQPDDVTVTLTFEQRQRSRARLQLDDGNEAALFLPHGTVLRDGDLLIAREGNRIRVRAAAEPVSTVSIGDPVALARLCYHLGNRHVGLQISRVWIRYQHDHVLDELVRKLGMTPTLESAPFEPEFGADHARQRGSSTTGGAHRAQAVKRWQES